MEIIHPVAKLEAVPLLNTGFKRYMLLSDVTVSCTRYHIDGVGDFALDGPAPAELRANPGERVFTLVVVFPPLREGEKMDEIAARAEATVVAGLRDGSLTVEYLDRGVESSDKLHGKIRALKRYGTDALRQLWRGRDSVFTASGGVPNKFLELEPAVKFGAVISAATCATLRAYLVGRSAEIVPVTYTGDQLRAIVNALPKPPKHYHWVGLGSSVGESMSADDDESLT